MGFEERYMVIKAGALNTNGKLEERAVQNGLEFKLSHSGLVHTCFDAFPFAGATTDTTGGVSSVFSLSSLLHLSLLEVSSSSTTH